MISAIGVMQWSPASLHIKKTAAGNISRRSAAKIYEVLSVNSSFMANPESVKPVSNILSGPTQADAVDIAFERRLGSDNPVRPQIIPSIIETVIGLNSLLSGLLPPRKERVSEGVGVNDERNPKENKSGK